MIQWLPVTIWWWLQWYVQYSLVLVEKTKHLTLEEIFSCWSVLSWEGWLLYKSDWWVEETGLESKCAEIQLGPTLVQSMWIIISRENLSKAKGIQESMTHTESCTAFIWILYNSACVLSCTDRNSAWPERMHTGCSILREGERAQLGLDTVKSQSHHLC